MPRCRYEKLFLIRRAGERAALLVGKYATVAVAAVAREFRSTDRRALEQPLLERNGRDPPSLVKPRRGKIVNSGLYGGEKRRERP